MSYKVSKRQTLAKQDLEKKVVVLVQLDKRNMSPQGLGLIQSSLRENEEKISFTHTPAVPMHQLKYLTFVVVLQERSNSINHKTRGQCYNQTFMKI